MAAVVKVTEQQQAALDAISEWWTDKSQQIFRLFGYAGTGKTTIAKLVPRLLGIGGAVRFAAYTGKAAHVLAKKGCTPVSTIHSLIYHPMEVVSECPYGDECSAPRDERTDRCAHEVRRLEFTRREFLGDDEDEGPELIILDEVSMVGQDLAADLMSFGVPILVLGDPAQLPPIGGVGFFTQATPDFMLTEVHRQAAESPVLRLATDIREGRTWGGHEVTMPSMADLHAAGQILCWKNATRWSIVRTLRTALGRPAGAPVPGDRLICIANNRGLNVFNGQQFWVVEVGQGRYGTYKLRLVDDEATVYELEAPAEGFVDQKGEELVRRNGSRGTLAAMTFANAITVHKAQGSEWDVVVVVDESAGIEWMGNRNGEDGTANRRTWLYTAITRASERVVLADARGW